MSKEINSIDDLKKTTVEEVNEDVVEETAEENNPYLQAAIERSEEAQKKAKEEEQEEIERKRREDGRQYEFEVNGFNIGDSLMRRANAINDNGQALSNQLQEEDMEREISDDDLLNAEPDSLENEIDSALKDTSSDDDIEVQKYYKTLVIPGAYSVDKYRRLEAGWSWFPQEQLSENERLAGLTLIEQQGWNCDLVLSHTCPVIYEPTDLFLSIVDQSMVEKDMERYLGQIEYQLDYKAWLWGHYHQFRDYPRTDEKYRTMLFNDAAVDLKDYMIGKVEKL